MKKIYSYSMLATMAMAAPHLHKDLFEYGTNDLVHGLKIKWDLGTREGEFHIHGYTAGGQNSVPLMTVYGHKREGKAYSYYKFNFTKAEYRKSLVAKWAPVTLPDGVKSCTRSERFYDKHYTKLVAHSLNGREWGLYPNRWEGGRRGKPGGPENPVVLNDETGEPLSLAEVEKLQLDCVYPSGVADLRWFPNSTTDRLKWVESSRILPGVEERACLESCLRTLKAGVELTTEFPNIGMLMMPAMELGSYGDWRDRWPDGEDQPMVYLDEKRFRLPAIVLFWFDDREADGEGHYTYVTVSVPPHGSPELNPWGRVSPISYDAKQQKRAYAFVNAILVEKKGQSVWSTWQHQHTSLNYGHLTGQSDKQEQALCFWPDNKDRVIVRAKTDNEGVSKSLPDDMAMRPDQMSVLIREKFLLESLPLC